MVSKRVIVQTGIHKGKIGVIVAVEGKNYLVQVDGGKPFGIKKSHCEVIE